jgi:3-hydroxyanthranilate 3,4-dioxygenase
MPRNHTLFTFAAAARAGNYDERPMLPDALDLQIHLSKNDRAQPFHLICQHDTVLMVMSGEGRVEYKGASVNRHAYELGDHLYVPAGVPHRIVPTSESILYRYKLPESEVEGLAWFCDGCGAEIYREAFDLGAELPQEAYDRICRGFNADAARRACKSCGTVHPPIDLTPYRWAEVAKELKQEQEAEEPTKAHG